MKFNKPLSAVVLVVTGIFLSVSAQAQRQATATPTVVNGFVVSVTVMDGGSGYTNPPAVTVSGGGGSGAVAISTVLNGAVAKIIVQNAGSGYTGTPTVGIDAPPSPKPPFSDGLIAYYPFNGNANDESGSGNNGTVVGATITSDRFGKTNSAYRFGGSHIDIPVDLNRKPLTLTAWFNTERPTGYPSQFILGNQAFNTPNQAVSIEWRTNTILVDSQSGSFTTDLQVVPSRWYQVTVCYTDKVRAFIDGSKILEVDYPVVPKSINPTSWIGDSQDAVYHGPFYGAIDDVRIYDRALSDQEVKDLYSYEAPERPWLSIEVKTVLVTLHVKPTKQYQLQASLDLITWTNLANPFVATTSEVAQEFNAIEVGRYFRIYEVQ